MSTDKVVAGIREAAETSTPVRVCGRGAWLDAGRPVQASKTISTRDDSGVVAYVPGDLTLTVRAGTTLREIDRITGEHEQWLPLDPYGTDDGTIGATIATASAGPLATGFGLPRDLVLGLEFVNGRGEIIRSGGRVVKNVAGFDLSRLITGSWGTLAVITEVTLRLYARPKTDRTFVVRLSSIAKETSAFLRAFLSTPVNPFGFELLASSAAASLGLGATAIALVRFGGNDAAVDAQVRALSVMRKAEEIDGAIWGRLRALEQNSESVIRVSGLPAHFRDASATILADSIPDVLTYINPLRGSLRLVVLPSARAELADEARRGIEATEHPDEQLAYEKLPAEVWQDVPSAVADSLSRGIKRTFDPRNILNPGLLGD